MTSEAYSWDRDTGIPPQPPCPLQDPPHDSKQEVRSDSQAAVMQSNSKATTHHREFACRMHTFHWEGSLAAQGAGAS